MNVFITGSTGFLGSNLIARLSADSRINKIYALTRKTIQLQKNTKIEYLKGDLHSIKDIVLEEKTDAVIHLAALIRSDNFKKLLKVNAEGTRNVIEFCRKNRIATLVFTSSLNVYLEHKGAYAKTKMIAEEEIKCSGLKYCILRLASVYGPGDGGFSRLINFIKKYGFVPIFGDGEKLEQPIYIDEAVEILSKTLFLDRFGITVDVAGKSALPYKDIIILLSKILNKKVILWHLPVPWLVLCAGILAKLRLPSPLTVEQIYHINENSDVDIRKTAIDFSIDLQEMESNLKKYIT